MRGLASGERSQSRLPHSPLDYLLRMANCTADDRRGRDERGRVGQLAQRPAFVVGSVLRHVMSSQLCERSGPKGSISEISELWRFVLPRLLTSDL